MGMPHNTLANPTYPPVIAGGVRKLHFPSSLKKKREKRYRVGHLTFGIGTIGYFEVGRFDDISDMTES